VVSEYVAGRYENVTVSFSKTDLQDVRNPFGAGNAFLYDINNSGSMVAGGGSAESTPQEGFSIRTVFGRVIASKRVRDLLSEHPEKRASFGMALRRFASDFQR